MDSREFAQLDLGSRVEYTDDKGIVTVLEVKSILASNTTYVEKSIINNEPTERRDNREEITIVFVYQQNNEELTLMMIYEGDEDRVRGYMSSKNVLVHAGMLYFSLKNLKRM